MMPPVKKANWGGSPVSDAEERKRAYRLAPCPAYDIEGTESWLEDMAEKGLVLSGDGFFAGVACFWKTEPRQLRYRLEAAPEGTGLWSGNGGLPAEEAVEINEAYGWKYVANRGQFHIYCTDDPSAREMHTDPDVQALALNIANKRARANMITALIYFMIFPLIHLRGGVLLTAVHMGSGLMLGGLLLVLIALGRTVARVLHLRRLRKRLSAGEAPHRKNWRRRALYHRLSRPIFIGLTIIWLGFFFQGWSNENLGGNIMPLEEFTGQIPFATLADMVPAGERAGVILFNPWIFQEYTRAGAAPRRRGGDPPAFRNPGHRRVLLPAGAGVMQRGPAHFW
jgi:hypothetical protein